MRLNYRIALVLMAGILIGVAGARLVHAQQPRTAPAYVIAEVEVTDPSTLQKYGEKAPQIVASFNGHYVVRGGKTVALEGQPPKGYIVVIGFDSLEKAQAAFTSAEYKEGRKIGDKYAKFRIWAMEGVSP